MREPVRLLNITAAELDKLRTLPAAVLATVGTVVVGIALAAALAAFAAEQGAHASATDVVVQAVPFVQTGLILLGVLPFSHERAGSQLTTTLAAVPRRGLLVAGKTLAALAMTVLAAVATVGGMLAAATTTARLADAPAGPADGPWGAVGVVAYLVLVGLFSHATALLVRDLVPALVGTLSLVLIVSPVLAGLTEHARWLPDRAAAVLYGPADPVLTAATGGLVTLAWIGLVGTAATVLFARRDP